MILNLNDVLHVRFIKIIRNLAFINHYDKYSMQVTHARHVLLGCFLIFTLLIVSACSVFDQAERTKQLVIKIDEAAADGDWDRVIELTTDCWGKDLRAYYRNLAFAHKGLLADSLMHHYAPFENALFYPISEEGSSFTTTAAGEVWWYLGDLTMAEHATIIGMIGSPGHKQARHLKRLYQINMASGNLKAAAKYRRILEADGEEIPADVAPIPTCHHADSLRIGAQYDLMLRSILEQNPHNKAALEYLLCLDLLLKDMVSYREDINRYGLPKSSVLFQEGMLVVMMNHPEYREKWEKYVSQSTFQNFMRFTQIMQDPRYKSQLKYYRNTYWYYYQFIQRNI